jgi:hypothetical protein
LRIQPLDDTAWPPELKDERNNPVLYRDFANAQTKLPIGFPGFEAAALQDVIIQTHVETMGKLENMQKQLNARRQFEHEQNAPINPVLYLQAASGDADAWSEVRGILMHFAIVVPEDPPAPEEDGLVVDRRKLRLRYYSECDGLVLLRARRNDSFRWEILAAYKDRQRLYQQTRVSIPWVIVDRVLDSGTIPAAENFRVHRIKTTETDWPDQLIQALRLSVPPR